MTEKMRIEAIERLGLLGVDERTIEDMTNGLVTKIEVDHEVRMVKRSVISDKEQAMIDEFEREHGYLVYYLIKDKGAWPFDCSFDRYTLLYVSNFENDWEFDKGECIRRCNTVPAYTVNVDVPDYSEFAEMPIGNVSGLIMNMS